MVNPILLIAVPLAGAFCIPLFGFLSKKVGKFIPPLAMLFNLVACISLVPEVIKKPIIVSLGGFPPPFCINLFVTGGIPCFPLCAGLY